MAKSIKLGNDLYWDITALHSIGLYSGTIQLSAGKTVKINLKPNHKGLALTVPLTDNIDAWGLYGLTAQGQANPYQYWKTLIDNSNIAISQGERTDPIEFTNSGAYSVQIIWIGSQIITTS